MAITNQDQSPIQWKYAFILESNAISLIDANGLCLTSSNNTLAGQHFDIKIDESVQTVPLQYNQNDIALLLLDAKLNLHPEYRQIIKSFAELTLSQYLEYHHFALDPTDHLVSHLINGYNPSYEHEYEKEANLIGYDLALLRVAIIIDLPNFWVNRLVKANQTSFEREQVVQKWKGKIESAINGFFTKNADLMTAFVGNDRFVVFKALDGDEWTSFRKHMKLSYNAIFGPLRSQDSTNVVVGYGKPATGIAGLLESYREAEISIKFGPRVMRNNLCYHCGDFGLVRVLLEGDPQTKLDYAESIIGKLAKQELITTLESLLDHNFNLAEASRALGIHRNTIIYRINQINSILGFDPRDFDNAVSLKIALLIKDLFAVTQQTISPNSK